MKKLLTVIMFSFMFSGIKAEMKKYYTEEHSCKRVMKEKRVFRDITLCKDSTYDFVQLETYEELQNDGFCVDVDPDQTDQTDQAYQGSMDRKYKGRTYNIDGKLVDEKEWNIACSVSAEVQDLSKKDLSKQKSNEDISEIKSEIKNIKSAQSEQKKSSSNTNWWLGALSLLLLL